MQYTYDEAVRELSDFLGKHVTADNYWKMEQVLLTVLDGKRKSKSFSITILGITEALRLAKEYRENKLKELEKFGIFYTERHGE